jgi:hemoglobin
MPSEQHVMDAIGKEGIVKIVASFYQKVKVDDLMGPMYPDDDWEGSEARLRDFLFFRIAQDPKYVLERGHPRLRMRHVHFKIDAAARDRWLLLMSSAMDENEVKGEAREFLDAFFFQVADFMRNQPE